jgi:uncharacterized protein (TIGR03437 family)
MRGLVLLCLSAIAIFAQSTTQSPVIGGAGYAFPVPLPVAPGQVITLFVQGANTTLTAPVRATNTPWPTTLAGVKVIYTQGSAEPAPILEVRPISTCLGIPLSSGSLCGTILAVTAQLPFQMLTLCPLCGRPDIPASIAVTVNGAAGQSFTVQPFSDQVHILTACDVLLSGSQQPQINTIRQPCSPMVTHADGMLVSPKNPANSGEELVAYAVGLGQTNPPLAEGQPASQPAPVEIPFGIDFNFHPNTLPAKPLGPTAFGTPINYPKPAFAGATPGFAGLYQINFIVAPAPDNLAPCSDTTGLVPSANVIQSNLTVSIGSPFSFDGAGICIQPGS